MYSLLEEFIKEALLEEVKKKKYPSQYKARGKRRKKLDLATSLAASDDPAKKKRGREMRDRREKAEREKKGFKNKPRHDTKKS